MSVVEIAEFDMYAPRILWVHKPSVKTSADGSKAGMTAEGVQAASKAAKQMTLHEAELILGCEAGTPWSEILKVCSVGCWPVGQRMTKVAGGKEGRL